ncbi:carbohydrate ABC transporter permease [Paenibacillus thalictri]|uniref:Carbohydrate ABC transporter permease n=1 Tax=Paenibacillus thalictri TaxID=2527873 RepID=A0A4Q9DIT1_9BACL|nr:carbohydrate ABC transporter permease [Paenibacillus thalictri]TBL70304.1 carbohydrate ABC transporter permease [Paenibacillus thalictri]
MKSKIKWFDVANYTFLTLFSLFCFLPILLVLIVSITDEGSIAKHGYSLFPEKFSLEAYRLAFDGNGQLLNSYFISILVTVVGTVLAVIITGMAAFTLANRQVKYRNQLSLFFFITMVFNTGLVPWYLVSHSLGLTNNLFALIIPSLIFNPFNLFLVRNFMNGIPEALMESAKIDGAGEFLIAFRIYFPLSVPVLATVALFYGLAYWNNWFNAIMLVDKENLYPLQYLLFKLNSELNMLNQMTGMYGGTTKPPTESFKMAIAIITIGPIVFLYPFLQRFFIKGLIVGSVKG